MKPRAGNIDSFCSELSHSNLKGLLIYPVRISDILSTGQGPGELTKAHQNKKKILRACGIRFGVTLARRIKKLKPFCNLTPCKSTTEKGQVLARITC